MRRTPVTCILAVMLLSLADASGQFSGPPRIFVVLPTQVFVEGVGVVGTPDAVLRQKGFHVELYAVDSFGNIDSSYEGEILDISVAGDTPPPGEPPHPPARRFGTSVSGAGAAMAIPPGSLRVSLGGSAFQEVTHGGASTPQGLCDAIVTAIRGVEPHLYGAGELDVKCATSGTRHRFFAIVDRTDMNLLLGADIRRGIVFDPTFGSAPALKLGSVYDPNGPADPNDPAEYAPCNVVPPAAADLKFSRGMAFFEVRALHVSGPGQIAIDQGGAGLPVETSAFTVLPLTLEVESVRLRDVDDDGSIDLAVMRMTEPLDPLSLPLNPSDFTLTHAGSPPIPGSAVTIVPTDAPGYQTDEIEVTFGTGIGKTDIKDVEVAYSSPSGMLGARSGTVVVRFTIADSTSDPASVRLIDAAPPVLVNSFAQDIDGNNGLDRLTLVFSEDVALSAGRGMSVGVSFDPAIDPNTMSFPVPSPLRLSLGGLTVLEQEIMVVDPNDPMAPGIDGAEQVARAVSDSTQRGSDHPAWGGATARFDPGFRRYIIRSGTAGNESTATVGAAAAPGDLAPLLKLGAANGGVERPGFGDGIADLDSLVIRGADGANLLFGKTEADVVIDEDTVTVELTNVPGSGTATPTYIWRDDGDGGFLTDKALVPNHAAPMNNAGLDPYFNPRELLVEASAASGPDLVLRVTGQPGPIQLDASQSILPLTAADDQQIASFEWRQVSGPLIAGGLPTNNGVVDFTPTVAGVYVFEITLTVPDPTGASYNAYLDPDRTLSRRLELAVTPGPAEDVVILLPGQTLSPGVAAGEDAAIGIPRVATEGVPYEIELVSTDAFHNETEPPAGAMARVTTTDPSDVEPPFQPFVGSRVRIRITPSDAAAAMIPEVDDEVLVAFEHGDIHHPYVVGSLWNASAASETDPFGRVKVKFTWPPDGRAIEWNVYRGSAQALDDLDHDGFPDDAYGTCVTAMDPDPADALFEDAEEPAPNDIFIYLGTMEMIAFGVVQETSLGVTGSHMERPNLQPCP